MRLSGDFLEAIALPDGRLGVLIGEMCGHGASQAAFGTVRRAGWKSIALTEQPDPADWLDSLERAFLADGRFDGFATVCSGIIDEANPSPLAVAGHPRPVALRSRAAVVDSPIGPPLGVGYSGGWEVGTFDWDRAPLLFYTCGLVENPRENGTPARWGDTGLLRWIYGRLPVTDPTAFVDTLITEATSGPDRRDDVAVLLVTRSGDGAVAWRADAGAHSARSSGWVRARRVRTPERSGAATVAVPSAVARKASAGMRHRRAWLRVVTVAERGAPRTTPISPNQSRGPSSFTTTSARETLRRPDSTTITASDAFPSSTTTVAAGTVLDVAAAASRSTTGYGAMANSAVDRKHSTTGESRATRPAVSRSTAARAGARAAATTTITSPAPSIAPVRPATPMASGARSDPAVNATAPTASTKA